MNNIYPWVIDTGFHCFKGMDRYTMSPDNFFSLQIFKNIHLFLLLVSPYGICHAMYLYKIEIVCLKLFPEAVNNHISIRSFSVQGFLPDLPRFLNLGYKIPSELLLKQQQQRDVFHNCQHSQKNVFPFHMPDG